MGVRRFEPRYLAAVREYLTRVFEVVAPHQIDRGGPVLLVQVENEYGAFGDDKRYLKALAEYTREAGVTVPLTTVDQPDMLEAGGLDGLHRTASFGSGAVARLAVLRAHQPTGPLMCAEFWNGWFDDWGTHHHTTSAPDAAAELDALLAAGASVNLYMFHGGTNFGLTSGANDKGVYRPIVTSYDYDAPLDEAGDPTPKYHAFREVIARYHDVPDAAPPPARAAPTPSAALGDPVFLLDAPERWGTWQWCEELPVFDELSPVPRLALLRTWVDGPGVLVFGEVRDRATVFLDGVRVGTLLREHHDRAGAAALRRGNCWCWWRTRAASTTARGSASRRASSAAPRWPVRRCWAGKCCRSTWPRCRALRSRPLRLRVRWPGRCCCARPSTSPKPADLFLDTAGWGKGMVWCNGFLLGRYWRRGPQRTLYVPRPVVRSGANELAVLELDTLLDPAVRFVPRPLLGHTEA